MSETNLMLSEEFVVQYNEAKNIARSALQEKKNIVLLGTNGANGKTYLTSELKPNYYTNLYGLQEINNRIPLKEKPFILETNNKTDLKKLDSFEIPYTLVDMPLSISKGKVSD